MPKVQSPKNHSSTSNKTHTPVNTDGIDYLAIDLERWCNDEEPLKASLIFGYCRTTGRWMYLYEHDIIRDDKCSADKGAMVRAFNRKFESLTRTNVKEMFAGGFKCRGKWSVVGGSYRTKCGGKQRLSDWMLGKCGGTERNSSL